MEYMVKIWGGGKHEFAKDYPKHKEYDGSLYYYFGNEFEMRNLIKKAQNYEKGTVVTSVAEENLHERVVACMHLLYKDKEYYHEQDFGYGYAESSAEFMYFDGNYSCDCNKLLFLSRDYPELSHLDCENIGCGDEIEILNFRIELRE